MIWFCISWVIHHDCNSEFTWISKFNKLWQILWEFYQNIFLCSLACESCYSKSGYSCPDWSWVGIRDSQVKSGQSRLIRDAWTLCKGFGGGGGVLGHAPRENNRNLRSSNCWKCIKIVNPTITTLFLHHFKYLRSHQADLFGSCGGVRGGACAPTGLSEPYFTCEYNCIFTVKTTQQQHYCGKLVFFVER